MAQEIYLKKDQLDRYQDYLRATLERGVIIIEQSIRGKERYVILQLSELKEITKKAGDDH